MIKKCFNLIFIILYASVLLGIISNKANLGYVFTSLAAIVILFISFKKTGKRKVKINDTLKIILFCLIHFTITCVLQYLMNFRQYADSLKIYSLSSSYLLTKDFSKMALGYIYMYPHNQFIFVLQAVVMNFITQVFNTNKEITYLTLKIMNSFIVSLSVFFMLMSVKNIWKGKYLKITMTILFLFIPLYIYGGILYTDTIALCLTSIIIFLASTLNFNKNIIRNLIVGIILALGYIIKPSMIIILIAFVIYKLLLKQWKTLIIGLVSFIIVIIIINTCANLFGFVSKEDKDKYAYPYTHWIMMGLTTKGLEEHEIAGFYLPDSVGTKRAGNYNEKIHYNIEQIQKRVKELRNKRDIKKLESKTV